MDSCDFRKRVLSKCEIDDVIQMLYAGTFMLLGFCKVRCDSLLLLYITKKSQREELVIRFVYFVVGHKQLMFDLQDFILQFIFRRWKKENVDLVKRLKAL